MIVHQARMQNKQGFLFRVVDIANELFAIAASVARAEALKSAGSPDARNAEELADMFGRISQRKVKRLFQDLWHNDDVMQYKLGVKVMEGEHRWMESGVIGVEKMLSREMGALVAEAAEARGEAAPAA
jgi:hypothetical protein